jgi:glycosyltransferase involved in cell wall biosynthesis
MIGRVWLFMTLEIRTDIHNLIEKWSIGLNPALQIITMKSTVVSAYYRISSKHTTSKYDTWIENFMQMARTMNTIIYGDKDSLKFLKSLYPETPTRIYIERRFEDFYTSKWSWAKEETCDPELAKGHNARLYQIWNEKIFMVYDAIALNPYNTSTFAWIDIGCFRDAAWLPKFIDFPSPSRFNHNTVSFLQIEDFYTSNPAEIYPVSNRFIDRLSVGATMFAGGTAALLKLRDLYEDVLDEADALNVFKGKDQNMYTFCILRKPSLFTLITPLAVNYDPWFSLHILWSQSPLKFVLVGPGIMPIPPTGWGACEILIWDYACELRKQGHSVDIVNTQNRQTMINEIKRLKPDYVHIQYDEHAEIASAVAPYVKGIGITSHYAYLEQPNRWATYKNVFNKIIAQNRANIHHLVLSSGIAKIYDQYGRKSHVIPNGANESLFRKTDNPLYPDRTICVGKIEERKRQAFLQPNTDVWFAGNKSAKHFDYTCERYLGEWTKTTLYNSLTDYGNLVLLSDGEADPLVVKEALVAGLGVVVSACAAANLDTSLPFITVIPDTKANDSVYVSEAIRANRTISVKMRTQIYAYSQNFYWSNLVKQYTHLVRSLIQT